MPCEALSVEEREVRASDRKMRFAALDSGEDRKLLGAFANEVCFSPGWYEVLGEWLAEGAGETSDRVGRAFAPLDDQARRVVAGRLAAGEGVGREDRLRLAALFLALGREAGAKLEGVRERTGGGTKPLTPVERAYLAGEVRLYTPKQFRRLLRRRAAAMVSAVRPSVAPRLRQARVSRRSHRSTAPPAGAGDQDSGEGDPPLPDALRGTDRVERNIFRRWSR